MKDNKKKNKRKKITMMVVGSTLTVASFIAVVPIIRKYENKIYKKSLNTEKINFDEMGPEIVPFNKENQEEE
jgi:flagellar basal body-associated protein FliL